MSAPAPAPAPGPVLALEAHCPECGAAPSPGPFCMACGADFAVPPAPDSLPPGGVVEAKKFECDGCGALMLFEPSEHGLKCPFCGSSRGLPQEDDYVAVEHALEGIEVRGRRPDAPKVFRCENCGAQVTFPGATVSSTCSFCGSEHVVERAGDVDRIPPESVIPFAVNLEKARVLWRAWLGKGLFRPRRVLDLVTGEALRGVYVPHWTYDTRAWSRWTAQAGYTYTVTIGSGSNRRTVTRIRWVPASGERTDAFDDILVAASKGLDDELLDRAKPYDLDRIEPYRSEYLAGFCAEEYTLDLPDGWSRARAWANDVQVRRCASDVPGDTHRDLRVWTQHGDVTWKHLLLPVWIASYRWKGKPFRFMVNGQTGKVAGTAPVSVIKVSIAVFLGLALLAGGFFLWRKIRRDRAPAPAPAPTAPVEPGGPEAER